VKLILPLFAVLLIASCNSTGGNSTRKDGPSPEDEKFSQAMEYYTLTHEKPANADTPMSQWREKLASQVDKQTAQRIAYLQEALQSWRRETVDARVTDKDRRSIGAIIEAVFRDPVSRSRMAVKTWDLKLCERMAVRFPGKNRCVASIMFYDRGPAGQAGIDLYLLKYEGRWELIYRVDWIN
jgi:hypothetical protein